MTYESNRLHYIRTTAYSSGPQNRQQGKTPKWQRHFVGPYVVVEKIGPLKYCIKRSVKSKTFVVHVDKLRPYLIT